MNNLAKVIALGGRRLNKALAMHYLFSEQGEPGYSIDNYVHDSANLILDGIWNSGEGVHSDTLTEWIDLSGNCQPTPLGATNTVGTNCISSDGTLSGKMVVPDVEPINLTTFTLELIYKKASDSTKNAVICGRDYTTSYYANISNNNLGVWLGNKGMTLAYGLDYSKAHTLQLTCDGTIATAWVDGVKKAENFSANAQSTPDNLILFGRKDGQSPLEGSIMAIRIHNRILTDSEIAQNYEIDQARFGLTETASVMMLGMPAETITDELEVTEDGQNDEKELGE